MIIAYLVAATFAAFAAQGGTEFPKLDFWRRWDPAAIFCALVVVYLIYALTGVAVTGLAEHFDLHVLSHGAGRAWINGAAYGTVALMFLRLNPEVVGLEPLIPAKVLLKAFLRGTTPRLESGAARAVARKVGDLPPHTLCRVSWQLYKRHVEGQMHPVDVARHARWLRALQRRALADGSKEPWGEADALEAQGHLRYYVERLIVDHEDFTIALA